MSGRSPTQRSCMRFWLARPRRTEPDRPASATGGDELWQSAMWCRSAGLAGWLLWDDLDGELQAGVGRIVEFEADRFLTLAPKSNEFGDTGAEENAWNAQILALACNMMPGHPRAERWDTVTKLWMYNSLSVAADATDTTPGDEGRPIGEWVSTVNAHPDYTVENHGLVHVGYLKTTLALLLEGALPYVLTGREPPVACLHHVGDGFRVLLKCMAWDASPVFFGGNDWKIYHSQNTDTIIYTLLGLLGNDARPAALEPLALRYVRRMQETEGGYYNVRRDIEYGGLCATRLIACYLGHAILGSGATPVQPDHLEAECTGVTHLEHARAVIHRTPTKFASFTWGPKCMALALPLNGNWVVWPHFESYTGRMVVEGSTPDKPTPSRFAVQLTEDAFAVTGRLSRFGGAVAQDIAYVSLPTDVTVYVERLTVQDDFPVRGREGGIVGLEYPLGGNRRVLRGAFGRLETIGTGGREARVIPLESSWLSINARVGYVIRRVPDRPNMIRYHDETQGTGRVPALQEWISLTGDAGGTRIGAEPTWTCIVTLLNADAALTRGQDKTVRFDAGGDRATVTAAGYRIDVDFREMATAFEREAGEEGIHVRRAEPG